MSDSSSVLAAFIIGAAVGVGVGILIAPEKGSDMRAKIKKEGMKMADTIQDKVKQGKERVEAWTEKVTRHADEARDMR